MGTYPKHSYSYYRVTHSCVPSIALFLRDVNVTLYENQGMYKDEMRV